MIKYILSIIAIVALNIGTLVCYTRLVSIPKIAVVDISKIVEKSEKVKNYEMTTIKNLMNLNSGLKNQE